MPTPQHTRQHTDRILEEIRQMHLPADQELFSLEIHKNEECWQIQGIVGPFARRIEDGDPYPIMCLLPLHDLEFSSKEEVLNFARKVHDILVERDKKPEATTTRLLALDIQQTKLSLKTSEKRAILELRTQ